MTSPEAFTINHPSEVTWSSVLTGKSSASKTKAFPAKVISGTVHITIPEEILQDPLPQWKTYVVGHFIGDSAPHIGKVHATVNRLWGGLESKTKIDANFIKPKTVLFKIDCESTRIRVLRRQFWHISDISMVVREWTPSTAETDPDLTAIPLWVDFAKVPAHLFSRKGLMFLGDSIGVAQRLHPNTERCTRFDVARILVELNFNSDLPERICLGNAEEFVDVTYPWLPPRCSTCNKWGHQAAECSQLKKKNPGKEDSAKEPIDLEKSLGNENQPKEIEMEQRMHPESGAEVLGAQQNEESEQVQKQISSDGMQVQITTNNSIS